MRPPNLAPSRRARVACALATLVLVCGYVDLVRGGVVIAPLLLVAGYVVLLPAALTSR